MNNEAATIEYALADDSWNQPRTSEELGMFIERHWLACDEEL